MQDKFKIITIITTTVMKKMMMNLIRSIVALTTQENVKIKKLPKTNYKFQEIS